MPKPSSDEPGRDRDRSGRRAMPGAKISHTHTIESLDEPTSELEAESIGRYLSQQRRLRGISIDQLAESTRIPKRSLERLEAGHFDHDVDGFVRGFVRTVSDGLGLDAQDTLTRMLSEPRVAADGQRSLPHWLGRALVGGVALLLVMLAVGAVRAIWQAGDASEDRAGSEPVVWRSDPVRALAEAHAARAGAPKPMARRDPAAE